MLVDQKLRDGYVLDVLTVKISKIAKGAKAASKGLQALDAINDASKAAKAADRAKDASKAMKAADKASDIVKIVDVDRISDTANIIRNSGGETIAGHALQKHAGRNPQIWGAVKGNSESINRQAMEHINDIIKITRGLYDSYN